MIRGPIRKPMSEAVNGGFIPDCWISAFKPCDLVPASAAKPSAAITRFSPCSGTRSAIVPRQAMRSSGAGSSGLPERRASASESLNASPTAASSRNG